MRSLIIVVKNKCIGPGYPVFIIAEVGVNHNGKLSLARKLIDAAAKAGADAVKFQTFSPDTLVTKSAEKAEYQKKKENKANPPKATPFKKGGIGEETQYEMLERLMLPREYHSKLKRYAEQKGLIFLSTPFSLSDAEFLRKLGVPAIKVGSSDTNNIPYLRAIAKWNLPLILSTGMSDTNEIREAVRTVKNSGNAKLILLHCTTNYPTPFSEANLRAIQTLQKVFNIPVGFSDHTVGTEAAVAAVALGASVIEKHFTLNKNLPGPDHKASLEPGELDILVRQIRNIEVALGTGRKMPFPSELKTMKVARKSVVTTRKMLKGEIFCNEYNISAKRPGTGLSPKYLTEIHGKKATRDIPVDTVIKKSDYTT